MKEIGIDIETYSRGDLAECGVYKYVEADDFAVLLFSYAIDGGSVETVDIAQGEEIPADVLEALASPRVLKTAYNAAFERVCLSRYLGADGYLPPEQWRCTMVAAARAGLPLSLGQCAEVLGLEQGKMKEGRALIRKFSCPGRGGMRTMPQDAPDDWETFKAYNRRDVEVEQAILAKVRRLEQPEWEERLYHVDQRINDRGVEVSRRLVENADRFNTLYMEQLAQQAKALTGLDNPNSPAQLKKWLEEEAHVSAATLNKKGVDDLIGLVGRTTKAGKMLYLRREMGKTSNKKYAAMLDCLCHDGRIHGLLQYYGAARTGRWAGRLVQVQNLPQNHLQDIDSARRMVMSGDLDEFSLCYSSPMQALSELIRTAFVAKEGHALHVCDFSAIEARVIAWLAGEEWVLDVFRGGGDVYCATATQMFGVKVEKHGPHSELRQKGKIAVLALGYGGGKAALEAMGGTKMGLSDVEMRDIVNKWRNANPSIVRLWGNVEKAAIRTCATGRDTCINRGLEFAMRYGCLTVKLPSGRLMCYPRACVEDFEKTYGGTRSELTRAMRYEGMNQNTKKWERIETYGGKMTENIVQAIARDILGTVMLRAYEEHMNIVFHVHDEIIVEAPPSLTLQRVEAIFGQEIGWAQGLPLKGAGYSTPYYLKE